MLIVCLNPVTGVTTASYFFWISLRTSADSISRPSVVEPVRTLLLPISAVCGRPCSTHILLLRNGFLTKLVRMLFHELKRASLQCYHHTHHITQVEW